VESEAVVAETPWSLRLNGSSYFWLKMKPWQLLVWSIDCLVVHIMFVDCVNLYSLWLAINSTEDSIITY